MNNKGIRTLYTLISTYMYAWYAYVKLAYLCACTVYRLSRANKKVFLNIIFLAATRLCLSFHFAFPPIPQSVTAKKFLQSKHPAAKKFLQFLSMQLQRSSCIFRTQEQLTCNQPQEVTRLAEVLALALFLGCTVHVLLPFFELLPSFQFPL